MKTTKKRAKEIYRDYQGVLYCLNGGTGDENKRNAPRCFERLQEVAKDAAEAAKNPSKLLLEDPHYLDAIKELPAKAKAFGNRYGLIEPEVIEQPEQKLEPILNPLEALKLLADCAGIAPLPGYKQELDEAMRQARRTLDNEKLRYTSPFGGVRVIS